MTESDKIIHEEIESILSDIRTLYEQSGRKVSGQFEDGLEAIYEPNKATIRGFVYLAGRGKTKKKGKAGEPTVLEQIKIWIQKKGIAAKVIAEQKPKTEKAKINLVNGLAYVITRKIHEQGTSHESWLRVYEQVITPERILSIIDRVSELNVNRLITEIRANLEVLAKKCLIMAINVTKEPSGIYPAYNDSFIEFTSDLSNHNRAEITVFPTEIFSSVFLIYPDADGNYLFNLKEAVKVIFNENGFEDENFVTNVFWKSISGLYLLQQIQIKVYNESTNETLSKNYEFFKAVKQISEPIHSNTRQLLSYSPDGINHSMTYFEGFPFHFDILQVDSGSDIVLKSLNTGNETEAMNPTASDSFRINVDRGGEHNFTSDNVLPLIEGLNRLELWEDGAFKSNILLLKKKICDGVYLKWWNRNGGFSHYLFDRYFIQALKSSDSGKVFNDEFNNIGSETGIYKSIGKDASGTITIKTKYEASYYELLKDIFISPLVQMYTSRTAYVEGTFIDVFVDGTISFSNKRGKNEIALIVDLPQVVTAKL